jgi:hypothetical protein
MRSTTGFATAAPVVVISSVLEVASRATKAQREISEMEPIPILYSAHEPTSILVMSTTNGIPAGTPGAWAYASDGSDRNETSTKMSLRMDLLSLVYIKGGAVAGKNAPG